MFCPWTTPTPPPSFWLSRYKHLDSMFSPFLTQVLSDQPKIGWTSKTQAKNKPFLLLSNFSQVLCHRYRKLTTTHISGKTEKYYIGTEVIQVPVLALEKISPAVLKPEMGWGEEYLNLGEKVMSIIRFQNHFPLVEVYPNTSWGNVTVQLNLFFSCKFSYCCNFVNIFKNRWAPKNITLQ